MLILGPAPNVPSSYSIEYEFSVDGAQFRRRERVREDYTVRVRGLSRRLGSLRAGEEVPVWYVPGAPVESTLMPSAVVGTVLPRHLGWAFLLVGLALVVMEAGAMLRSRSS